jgi:hypothetical protein
LFPCLSSIFKSYINYNLFVLLKNKVHQMGNKYVYMCTILLLQFKKKKKKKEKKILVEFWFNSNPNTSIRLRRNTFITGLIDL